MLVITVVLVCTYEHDLSKIVCFLLTGFENPVFQKIIRKSTGLIQFLNKTLLTIMKKELQEALLVLKKSKGKVKEVEFEHTNIVLRKSVKAKINWPDNSHPLLTITKIIDYSPTYVEKRLAKEFKLFLDNSLPLPKVGDIIRIEVNDMITLNTNNIGIVSAGVYYFSVEDSDGETPISCEGAPLHATFEAEFIRDDNSICSGGTSINFYNLFKLKSII